KRAGDGGARGGASQARRARRRQHAPRRRRGRGRHDRARPFRGGRPDRLARGRGAVNAADFTWAVGRPTIGLAATLGSRLKVYGKERVPRDGGIVVASNHFSWLDPAVLGVASP